RVRIRTCLLNIDALLLIIFYFSLIPPPPRSTLFPYTTLFRSLDALERVEGAYSLLITVGRTLYAIVDPRGFRPLVLGRLGRNPRDRKSTRLNSSHVAISYAVFCLKKKKLKYQEHRRNREAILS